MHFGQLCSTCEKVRNLNLIEKTPIKNKTCGQTHPSQLRWIIYQKTDVARAEASFLGRCTRERDMNVGFMTKRFVKDKILPIISRLFMTARSLMNPGPMFTLIPQKIELPPAPQIRLNCPPPIFNSFLGKNVKSVPLVPKKKSWQTLIDLFCSCTK